MTHVMPYEEALKEVADFMSDLSPTRGDATRTVSEVRVVKNTGATRADGREDIQLTDTVLYIFNFANDQGFAIVSADSRSEGLLAFTGSGHFGDTIDNPGFAVFYSRIADYQLEAARRDKALKDSLYERAREKVEKLSPGTRTETWPNPLYGSWGKIEGKELAMNEKLHQRHPYNAKTPVKDGKNCAAGCAPVAVVQIMRYYRYPVILGTHAVDWAPRSVDVAEIIYQVGHAMETTWGVKSSSTLTRNIPYGFKAMGYMGAIYQYEYDAELVRNSIAAGFPVLIGGWAKRVGYYRYDDGHFWVLEGYIKQRRNTGRYDEYGKAIKEERYLVRCNYGWGGSSDGYYLSGVFNTNTGLVDPNPDKDHWVEPNVPYSTRGDEDGYYQHNIIIFPNIFYFAL